MIGSGGPSADDADSVDEPRNPGNLSQEVSRISRVSRSEPSGRVVVLWLFIALAAATALILLYFATIVDPEFRPRIYVALVGNLALPIIAWYVYKHLPRHQPPA